MDYSAYHWSEKARKYAETLGTIFNVKGRVNTFQDLPQSGNKIGDVYLVGLTTDPDLSEYAWLSFDNVTRWEKLGSTATSLAFSAITGSPNDNVALKNALDGKYSTSNPDGYISGITSSMVTTALGYTPYDSSNPSGYTSNVGTVTSVNNVQPVNGNVQLSIPSSASDVGALPDTTKYGADLSYSSNILQLLDQDGNALGNSVTVPDTTFVDSDFHELGITIASSVSVHGTTGTTYTLSGIPNDGKKHMALISTTVVSGSTSGNAVTCQVTTSLMNAALNIAGCMTRTSSSVISNGAVWIPVPSDRKITLNKSNDLNGNVTLYLRGYRRIGTND